jgi:uncharacterized protein (TIGR02246 family)
MLFKRLGLAAGCALALAASWLAVRAIPARGGESDEAAIRKVFDDQTAAWNRGDTDAFMAGYWKSPDTEFVGASGILRGWDAVLARYHRVYPDAKAMGHLSFSNLEIKVLSADAAYATGEYHLQREKDRLSGVYTVIVRKLPEGWRVVHDHTTAYPAPAAEKTQ